MCPEPDFGMEYRQMIATYRLSPEVFRGQLDAILSRLRLSEEPERSGAAEKETAVH